MSVTNRIFLSPPSVGAAERRAVGAAFDSNYIAPCGPQVDEFERRLAKLSGRKYAVALTSGTAALDLLMDELRVDKTWTVIAPTLAFIATVGPAYLRGAKIEFVDCDETGNIDVSLLETALKANTSSPKHPNTRTPEHPDTRILVIGVDLYGNCCDYRAIAKLCRAYKATFVCDSAESVGSCRDGRPSGSAGLAAIYSFNGNKVVTTSGGGALVTDSKGVAFRAKKRAQQSREAVLWYEHKEVGHNYRLSNLLAAVGVAQLGRLPEILKKRAATAKWYARLCGARMLAPVPGSNNWLNVIVLDSRRERDALLKRFAAADIEARPVWKPMHLQPVFAKCRVYGGEVAEALFARGACLPSGTGLTASDRARIAAVLKDFI